VPRARAGSGTGCGRRGGFLRHLPEIRARRRSLQARRRLRDRDLLTGGPVPFNPRLAGGRVERAAQRLLHRLADANWRLVARVGGAGG
jgi:hypothetical protein